MSTGHNPFQSPGAAPQPSEVPWWNAPFQSGHRRAAITIALLMAIVILSVIFLAMTVLEYLSLVKMADGTFAPSGPGEKIADNITLLLTPNAVISITTVVAFCMWTYRVARNLPALGARKLKYTPGWAVGWFFLPFANIVMPYFVASEIWRESDPTHDPEGARRKTVSPLVAMWWFAYVATAIIPPIVNVALMFHTALDAVARGAGTPNAEILIAQNRPSLLLNALFGQTLTMVAAILAILYVRRIDHNQETKFDRIAVQGFVA